jgi:site-specific recombinase XerD
MSPARRYMTTMHERYDQALEYCHDKTLPPYSPRPKPTKDWPPENVALLGRYGEWLSGGGASEAVIRTIYIPMAGHVLGLFLKPYPQLDLDADLQPAFDYIQAKGAGPDWTDVCRNSLTRFRRFLMNERGQIERKIKPYDVTPHTQGLPEWLVTQLERYQHVCQRNWREARLEENIRRFWSGHLRVWRFLCEQRSVKDINDLRRVFLYDYADARLQMGSSVSTINADLRGFHSFMGFLQEQGYAIPQSLLRVHGLKQPDRLPQFLTDDQVRLIREDFERQVAEAKFAAPQREALLIRAAFYLLWQGGLRKGEVEELRLEDLDLPGRKLTVRKGKNLKDRTVFLTDNVVKTLTEYLARRGIGPTDHVFLYRNQPLGKDLIHGRLKLAGERIGVKLHAHRLRHTCATQLLNAGCPVTSIQKFLGHKKLNSTMIYARVYDKTVEEDYFSAMARVEQRLAIPPTPGNPTEPVSEDHRQKLLGVAEKLEESELGYGDRLELATVIRVLLGDGTTLFPVEAAEYLLKQVPP